MTRTRAPGHQPYTTIEEVCDLLPRTSRTDPIVDRFGERTIVEALYAGQALPRLKSPNNDYIVLTRSDVYNALRRTFMVAGWQRETEHKRAIINALGCTDAEADSLAADARDWDLHLFDHTNNTSPKPRRSSKASGGDTR